MKHDRIEAEVRRGALASHASARSTWTERASIRVRVHAASGPWGEGEAAPLPGVSSESMEEVLDAARALDPAGLEAEGHPWGWRIDTPLPSLRFAIETALVDLRSRQEGRSGVAVLGGDPRRRIPVNGLVDRLGVEGERLAQSWLRRGVRTLKVKVGRPGREADELALLAALWDRTSAHLRLDANGHLGPKLAEWVRERARKGPRFQYVEDPGPRTGPGVPTALDDALREDPDLLDRTLPKAVILKPTLWGGYAPLARVAARARALGVGVVVTHTFEIGAGFDAAVALGLTLGTPGLAQGLAPHGFLLPSARPHRLMQGWLRWRDPSR